MTFNNEYFAVLDLPEQFCIETVEKVVQQAHHLQANVAHYGDSNGRRWEGQFDPIVRNLMLSME